MVRKSPILNRLARANFLEKGTVLESLMELQLLVITINEEKFTRILLRGEVDIDLLVASCCLG